MYLLAVVAVLCVVVEAVIRVDAAARAGERIYLARHRDHTKVPRMRWRDDQ